MSSHQFCRSIAIIAAITAIPFSSALADESASDPSRQWAFGTVQVENDLFANVANTDRHYTNGLQASVLSHPLTLTGWQKEVATARMPFGLDDAKPASHRVGLALGHSIFTPDDTDTSGLVNNDRPYAAWLHLTFTLQTLWTTNGQGTF
jgi:lipid A 3-O-deacylase